MLKLFVLMLMTFILVSCGGGKSTATLSISRGMVLANTSFSGGIYITGEKTDGSEYFATTITSGNTANVTIGFGTWNFKVIGWDGGGAMSASATAYCKYLPNYAFTAEGQQLEITTAAADCFDGSHISGTNQHITANAGPFKSLVVNSCGAMYNPSDSSLVYTQGNFDFCGSANYPVEYKKTFGYYKLHLENQTSAGIRSAGISSACLATQTNQTVKFPNRMPVTIRFYKDSGCTAEVDEYRFKKGLDFSLSPNRLQNDFDWQVTADTVSFFTTVASGASKRGTSAFHTEVPFFKCDESSSAVPCTKYPTAGAGYYYVDPESYAVIALPQTTCGSPTLSGGITGTIYSCDVINGKAYVSFKVAGLTPAMGTLAMNGQTVTIKSGNPNAGYTNDRVRDAYKTMKRAFGFRNNDQFDSSLQDDVDEGENQQVGLLDSAIYDISALGAGGTFFDYHTQCTTAALTQVPRSYVKNGFSYSVALSGIAGVAPAFTARSDEPEFMGSEVHYNRRLVVRKLVGPSFVTEKIIDFSCDNFTTNPVNYVVNAAQVRNGKMEEQRSYSYGDSSNLKVVELKKKIFWNTSSSDTSRFDVYRSKHVKNSTGTTQKIERNFYRVTKAPSDSFNDFKIHSMNYEVARDGSSFDESINVNEVDGSVMSGIVSYSHKRLMDLKLENGTVGNIFSATTFGSELNKVRYGYRPGDYEVEQTKVSSVGDNFIEARRGGSNFEVRYTDSGTIQTQTLGGVADNIATDISPDGTNFIAATNSGTTISYVVIINGIATAGTISATNTPAAIKAAILDDGTFVIAHIESGTFQTLHWNVNGTNSSSPYNGISYTHRSIDITKDSSMFYLMFTRSNSANTEQRLDICKMNATTNCGFNTMAIRNSGSPFTYASAVYNSSNIHFSYIHDSQVNLLYVDAATLLSTGTETQPTDIKFVPYEHSNYSNLSAASILRNSAGSQIDILYPYYNPTITGFEMKPIKLQQSSMDSLFTTGFSAISN